MSKMGMLIMGGALILLVSVAGIAQFLSTRSAVSPTLSTATSATEQDISTTTASGATVMNVRTTQEDSAAHPLPLADGDHVVSWSFRGAYADNPELVAKAQDEIKRLSGLLAAATSPAMILSVGIANQYELIGDGEKQYEYLGRAVRENATSGLPWHNLGVLMERLGAYETARIAYEKSTIVQPGLKQWHYAYLEFLTSRTGNDTTHIEEAFAFAEENIGKTRYLIELRAEWQKP